MDHAYMGLQLWMMFYNAAVFALFKAYLQVTCLICKYVSCSTRPYVYFMYMLLIPQKGYFYSLNFTPQVYR